MNEVKKKVKMQEFDWVVLYTVFQDVEKPVTIQSVRERYNWTWGKAFRCLERLHKGGYCAKRQATFWNGMHYARRFYYW